MNSGTTRIIIVVALALVGLVVLVDGFSSSGGQVAQPGTSVSPTKSPHSSHPKTSKTPRPSTSPQPAKKISFYVLNGTTVAGLAGTQEKRLEKAGLTPALDSAGFAAGDAPHKPQSKTIVYFRSGPQAVQNRADAQWVADTYFSGALVRQMNDALASPSVVPAAANVVVLVGTDTSSP